jgi:hypothetical protein
MVVGSRKELAELQAALGGDGEQVPSGASGDGTTDGQTEEVGA